MSERDDYVSQFREAVKLLDAQRRILLDAGAAPRVTDAISAIIKHLHSLPSASVEKIVAGSRYKDAVRSRRERAAAAVANMTLDAIELAARDEKATRLQLEAIAVGRFQVPSGSLRSLGGIDQLREKIATLVDNERAHEAISSVVKEAR